MRKQRWPLKRLRGVPLDPRNRELLWLRADPAGGNRTCARLPACHGDADDFASYYRAGHAPPAQALAHCADDARAILREQVEFARALTTRERTARCFQVPIVPFPEERSWINELERHPA